MEIRKEKMRDIVDTLDIFNGQISLTEILNQDIPILSGLQEAKISKLRQSQQQRGK